MGTSLDSPSSSFICLGPLGPASQMPLESTQAHGRCLSSHPHHLSPGPRPPPTFCWALHLRQTPVHYKLSSQACPQCQVHNDGYPSVPICQVLSKLLKSRPCQVDGVGWRGPGGQAQTPVRPIAEVKLSVVLQQIMTLGK